MHGGHHGGRVSELDGVELQLNRVGLALGRLLPPGQGSVPFKEMFAVIAGKGYSGPFSYEAPNPAAWARPAGDVAREALAATRAVLP